jgi:hypothetical protein
LGFAGALQADARTAAEMKARTRGRMGDRAFRGSPIEGARQRKTGSNLLIVAFLCLHGAMTALHY